MNYSELINSSKTVLVEFYASWCPHCQRMIPVVAEIKELLEGQADVYQFDIDENNSLADSQGVSTIPTFILYSNGKEVWRHSGEIDGQALLSKIRAQM